MKRYDKEFREQALKLSDEVGIKKASEQLGVVYGTLADWRKKRVRNNNNKKEVTNNPDDEIARLKKENNELQKANSILKDALGFFVEDRKR
jgi:transposase